MKKTVVLDIEIYKNYFLIAAMDIATGKVVHYDSYPGKYLEKDKVKSILDKCRIVTFNGNSFDMPLIGYALEGAEAASIKDIANLIIVSGIPHWKLEVEAPKGIDHIDLIEVAPGQASLKIYGGRLHADKLQDLPIDPEASISEDQRILIRKYCENDLKLTALLYKKLLPQIELRERMSAEYGQDLRSRSDAQIAELVIKSAIYKATGKEPKKPRIPAGTKYKYHAPDFINYQTPLMRQMFDFVKNCIFIIDKNGSPKCTELDDYQIKLGASTYRMGVGGLHSSEKKATHVIDDDTVLIDRDVASYYPAIILNCGLYPKHMGEKFLDVYKSIVDKRLDAKRNGDKVTADALKITINGSFGKFGSMYSSLYSPDLLIQTTITGQLALLMLIESLESDGINVVSANTDGIVIKCKKVNYPKLLSHIELWEFFTGFETEETNYKGLYSRDVNNYLAIKTDGEIKTKGVFAGTNLMKSPSGEICTDAVKLYLTNGDDIKHTIENCRDIRKFLHLRAVTGGAMFDGEEIGKSIRWYYSKNRMGAIHYKKNGNKVAGSDGAIPMMNITEEFPEDVDFCRYIKTANDILEEIGLQSR